MKINRNVKSKTIANKNLKERKIQNKAMLYSVHEDKKDPSLKVLFFFLYFSSSLKPNAVHLPFLVLQTRPSL